MSLALALAARGQGFVEPNPMVGCVIVRGGRVVGSGWHRKFGGPHAEVIALREAGRRARGAVAYVTLEPCSHFGKTPPCADALIRAGVSRVIAAMKDPNPLVAGRGLARLRSAGIDAAIGLCEREAGSLNAPFITYHLKQRPYVILKWAQSIDGKIATRSGDSKWISSPESRRAAHALRARVDGILIGINTVLADDPDLTARLATPRRVAARVVLDTHLRIPSDAELVRTAHRTPTLIVTGVQSRRQAARRRQLMRAGCEILEMPNDDNGIRLAPLLRALRDRGMTNLLVEGGGRVLGSFVEQGLADEAMIFVAPRLIGGESAPGPLQNLGPASLKNPPCIDLIRVAHFAGDICYTARFREPRKAGRDRSRK